ncbi:MAG: hypothetical protein KC457_25770, partial [Myxococcales bacterium]|nr:hypothetical protein [Myxococcales bacterium]
MLTPAAVQGLLSSREIPAAQSILEGLGLCGDDDQSPASATFDLPLPGSSPSLKLTLLDLEVQDTSVVGNARVTVSGLGPLAGPLVPASVDATLTVDAQGLTVVVPRLLGPVDVPLP